LKIIFISDPVVSRSFAMQLPPPPHDPREREIIGAAAHWQVRQFPATDRKLTYFATRGFGHLQLWCTETRTSILTPSRLTGGNFEAWIAGGPQFAGRSWSVLVAQLAEHGVVAPPAAEVRALERWLVTRIEPPQLRLLRTWWAAPR
jgi:hypothetical protein